MTPIDLELCVYSADVFVMRLVADRRYFLVLNNAAWQGQRACYAVQDDFGNLVRVEK
jgi:hypothetical protein